ncbi:MAG TPA: recombination regulator RecX [Burkholderiales bacterium]|nr:recombination regulator RecX [Burkholderiales bacterium]
MPRSRRGSARRPASRRRSRWPPRPRRPDLKKDLSLRERAVAFLARREHTRAELARRLAPHADDLDQIEPLLDDLVRRKLLSDDRYAEARAHTLARKFGTARIEHELRAKGVSGPEIAKVATAARATELERAREAWKKRFGAPPASAAERAKQMRFLQGRGFSFDVIRRVVAGAEED